MKRIKEFIQFIQKGIFRAILRFPLTGISLVGAAILICYMISLRGTPPVMVEKLMFTSLFAAILGMAAQFAFERFKEMERLRPAAYGISALVIAGYFMILWPVPAISSEISIRTFVAVFAMICAVLWFPSVKEKADFNKVALIHFKAVFTSVLYAAVLSAGIAAIIAAVDILLINVDNDAYAYMMTIIWVMFATVYYLSLLPKFNSLEESDLELTRKAEKYPRFLEILVSYIAIPLVGAYTLVLLIYFVKILVTTKWPSGQLGPMVLAYSATGLLLFVLSSLLENRFAILYRKIFPKILIPIVVVQLISVSIRLNAYGITESRYYVALFGIFSIAIGILLSIRPVSKNSVIALLAAGVAIFSVIPPVDAFTVSRVSQTNRIEGILQSEGILKDGKLTPKADASEQTKIESTNILSYLENRKYLGDIKWLPSDFNVYEDIKNTLGFEPTYPNYSENENQYYYVSLDTQIPMIISGYDISVMINSDRYAKDRGATPISFTIGDAKYELLAERSSNNETRISIKDSKGVEVIGSGLYDFAKGFFNTQNAGKEGLPPEKMTFDVTQNGYKMRLIFQNISITAQGADAGVDYSVWVLFGTP